MNILELHEFYKKAKEGNKEATRHLIDDMKSSGILLYNSSCILKWEVELAEQGDTKALESLFSLEECSQDCVPIIISPYSDKKEQEVSTQEVQNCIKEILNEAQI
jgi:hypothetical protein